MNRNDFGIEQAAKLIGEADYVVALTGAGISVDSGIPDFRSPQGLWSKYDPMEYAGIDSFRKDPHKIWKMIHEMRGLIESAKPNPAHEALAKLGRMGILKSLVTQNIDNLHQMAGSENVIEFHGNASRLSCIKCMRKYEAREAENGALGDPPVCECGQVLKPDIIFFGEAIPQGALIAGLSESQKADVMLIVGTSATVAPANQLPMQCLASGGKLIEFNLEETHLSTSGKAFHVAGNAGETLALLVERLEAMKQ